MVKFVCEENKCTGCMACIDSCPRNAIRIEDSVDTYNATIQEDKCISCNKCHDICQVNHPVDLIEPSKWYQGWANRCDIRETASSGGLSTAIAMAFIENGGEVCSCVFRNGELSFEFADSVDDLDKFKGSKYVKSNPCGIYKKVRDKLKTGRKVLYIALPCQVAAIKKYLEGQHLEGLYTVDLICHGTPSPLVLELFLKQYNISLESLENISFRDKNRCRLHGDHLYFTRAGVMDPYSIAFLNALTYTENCYSCQYAKLQRISDLTLGDSWGSELPESEKNSGISLALCQSEMGIELLNMSNLCLKSVDLQRAVENNHQLKSPSNMPSTRYAFFKGIKANRKFNSLTFKALPKQYLRQVLKSFVIKFGLFKRHSG